MLKLKRILLIARHEMTHTPAFDRAQALASATGALLHIVAFDFVPALAVAGLFDHDAMAQAREGWSSKPGFNGVRGCRSPLKWSGPRRVWRTCSTT